MELSVSFGVRLREERERLRLNQTAFAATGGVTKKTQMLYEAGERFPDVRYLAAVQEIGCDVRYVVTGLRDVPPAETLAPDEQVLLDGYRNLDPATRKRLMAFVLGGEPPPGSGSQCIIASGVGTQAAGRKIVNKKEKS